MTDLPLLQLLSMLQDIHAGRANVDTIDTFAAWLAKRRALVEAAEQARARRNRPRAAHGQTTMLIMTYDPVGFCECQPNTPSTYNRNLDFLICDVCKKRRDRRKGNRNE